MLPSYIKVPNTPLKLAERMGIGNLRRYKKTGRVAIDVKHLHDVVRELGVETLSLNSLENHWLELSAGKAKFKIGHLWNR